jgi:hypothetical protein
MNAFEQRESVVFENEGQKIYGSLHLPLSQKKSPAVLICHGLAGNRIGKYRLYVKIAERLTQLGVAALRIDFRGSGESEGDFSQITVESEVSDALKAFEFLRHHASIDPIRMGILGNSFGGAVAVLAAAEDRKVKGIALLASLFDSKRWKEQFELLATSSNEELQKEKERLLEGLKPGASFYGSFFRLNIEKALLKLNNVPLLHIHSEHDERVGMDQTEHFKRCRQHANSETCWISLKKCDHDFCNFDERAMIIEDAAQWFAKTL